MDGMPLYEAQDLVIQAVFADRGALATLDGPLLASAVVVNVAFMRFGCVETAALPASDEAAIGELVTDGFALTAARGASQDCLGGAELFNGHHWLGAAFVE